MARIFGIEIPNEKRIEASLCYIYGVGQTTALKILEQAGVDGNLRTGELSEEQLVATAQLAIRLEEKMGWPVDVETAYCKDVLYLLQCRLITTLIEPDQT